MQQKKWQPQGMPTVLVAVYALFALAATARSGVQIIRDYHQAPLAYGLSFLAAITYIAVTVALIKTGARSRLVRVLCSLELCGVIVVGLLSLLHPELFPKATVWSDFGIGYGFVPLVLPLGVLGYNWWSSRKSG